LRLTHNTGFIGKYTYLVQANEGERG